MPFSTTNNKDTWTGDGSQTTFPFTFYVLQDSDIDVYADGDLVSASDYTVSINGNNIGGNIIFDTAPADDTEGLTVRTLDYTQTTDLPTEGAFDDETVENMIDRTVMMAQQLEEKTGRAFTLPITSTKSGVLNNEPTASLVMPVWNNDDEYFEFVSIASAFNEAVPAAGGGNLTGPGPTVVDKSIAIFNGTGGLTVESLASVGTANQLLQSNGAGVAPSFVTRNFFLKSANILSSIRALPTSGALSGTYIHLGDWTSTGSLTFSHDTRIYLKGNVVQTSGHTFSATVQANGGTAGSAFAGGWGRGGGAGGDAGHSIHGSVGLGGGAGGGGGGAGGRGGYNGATSANAGGKAHNNYFAGGGGGGAGSGDLASTLGSVGGGGGPSLYFEVDGNVTLNETLSSNGAAGTVGVNAASGAGGGGAGGNIIMRISGTLSIATGKKITATGGAGGAEAGSGRGGGGGGGGTIDVWSGGAQTLPDGAGTHVTAAGGASGGGTPTTAPAAGSAGTTTLLASVAPVSFL